MIIFSLQLKVPVSFIRGFANTKSITKFQITLSYIARLFRNFRY